MKTLQAILVIGILITGYLLYIEAQEFVEQMEYRTQLEAILNQ
jgi:hypothetical protein